ncbi:MAG: hypothetical protein WC198_03435 [Victivallaceae bacterium]
MADYIAEKIFRQLTPEHFNALTQTFKVDLQMENGKSKSTVNDMAEQWVAILNNGNLDKETLHCVSGFHDFLQNLSDLAEGKCDIATCARTTAREMNSSFGFPEDFDSWTRYNQGAYLYLNDYNLWKNMETVATVSNIENSRLWTVYNQLPKESLNITKETSNRLAAALKEHFIRTKPSKNCLITHYPRGDQHYFFATLQDRRQYFDAHNEETDTYEPVPLSLAFRLVFCYNEEEGEFAIHGKLGKADFDILAGIIVPILLEQDCPIIRAPKAAYDLSQLKDRRFSFPYDPEDGIDSIWVKSLTVAPADDKEMQISLRHSRRNIYDCLEEFMDKNRLNEKNIEVQKALIAIKMKAEHPKFKSMTFEIRTHGCDLHGMADCKRLLGEKYVKEWRLKVE